MTKLIDRPQYLNQLIQNKDVDPTLREIILAGFVPSVSVETRCVGFSHYPYESGVFALS